MIEVIVIQLDERIGDYRSYLMAHIGEDRARRLNRFRHLDDLDRSLLADICVRHHAMHNLGVRDANIRYAFGRWGKPHLPQLPSYHFNWSHSGRYVLCAFAGSPVGCDIEFMQDGEPFSFADELAFASKESEALRAAEGEERRKLFYRLWTRKESFIKATGQGLSESLPDYSVLTNNVEGAATWSVRSYDELETYQMAVCCEDRLFPEVVYRMDTVRLIQEFLDSVRL